jgi:hypothetical protein
MNTKKYVAEARKELTSALEFIISAKIKLDMIHHTSAEDAEKVRSKLNLLIRKLI